MCYILKCIIFFVNCNKSTHKDGTPAFSTKFCGLIIPKTVEVFNKIQNNGCNKITDGIMSYDPPRILEN